MTPLDWVLFGLGAWGLTIAIAVAVTGRLPRILATLPGDEDEFDAEPHPDAEEIDAAFAAVLAESPGGDA